LKGIDMTTPDWDKLQEEAAAKSREFQRRLDDPVEWAKARERVEAVIAN
jgi:hypothetical protein